MNPLVYFKLAGIVALVGLLWWVGGTVNGWHKGALRADAADARRAQVEREAAQTIAAMKDAYAASQKASEDYQHELASIRNRPVVTGPVRLCLKPAVPAARTVARGPGPTVPATGLVQRADGTDPEVRSGPDIGPALRRLAGLGDEMSARGRATQAIRK